MPSDIALYSVPVGTHLPDSSATLSLGFPGTGPRKVSGPNKVLQMVAKNLLDSLGSASYDTSLGTDFMDLIFRVGDSSEAYSVTSTALRLVEEKMKTENSLASDEDEQLSRIELESVEHSGSQKGWMITFRIYTVSGLTAQYLFGLQA